MSYFDILEKIKLLAQQDYLVPNKGHYHRPLSS